MCGHQELDETKKRKKTSCGIPSATVLRRSIPLSDPCSSKPCSMNVFYRLSVVPAAVHSFTHHSSSSSFRRVSLGPSFHPINPSITTILAFIKNTDKLRLRPPSYTLYLTLSFQPITFSIFTSSAINFEVIRP